MGFMKAPQMQQLPPVPPVPPSAAIKPADTKEGERVATAVRKKRGVRAARVTGGLGLTTEAPTSKKTLLGQ